MVFDMTWFSMYICSVCGVKESVVDSVVESALGSGIQKYDRYFLQSGCPTPTDKVAFKSPDDAAGASTA